MPNEIKPPLTGIAPPNRVYGSPMGTPPVQPRPRPATGPLDPQKLHVALRIKEAHDAYVAQHSAAASQRFKDEVAKTIKQPAGAQLGASNPTLRDVQISNMSNGDPAQGPSLINK